MPARTAATRWRRFTPIMLIGVLNCDDCSSPWPAPAPVDVKHLGVAPNELFIYVSDPTREDRTNLVAYVHGDFGRNIDDHTTTFAVTSGDGLLSLAPLGSHPDSMTLVVAPACSTTAPCTPSPLDGVVTAIHSASGLTLDLPVHVRYALAGDHGVAATPTGSRWPMYGMATGTVSGDWKGWTVHAFVRRTGFVKFDPGDVSVPLEDEPAAVVLSREYAGWRKAMPWKDPPNDVTVPNTDAAARSKIMVKAFYAGDPGSFGANEVPFQLALEGAADIVSYTPVGAWVTVDPAGVTKVNEMEWTMDCPTIGDRLKALPPEHQPSAGALSVYMLAVPSAVAPGERAAHCGPDQLALPDFRDSHVIIVPQGSPRGEVIAHEIGHAFALEHVTMGSGFFDDNLMVLTDEISAPMRNRLTLGQAFRAALHPRSFIVTSGAAKSNAVECLLPTKRCPDVAEDAVRRTP